MVARRLVVMEEDEILSTTHPPTTDISRITNNPGDIKMAATIIHSQLHLRVGSHLHRVGLDLLKDLPLLLLETMDRMTVDKDRRRATRNLLTITIEAHLSKGHPVMVILMIVVRVGIPTKVVDHTVGAAHIKDNGVVEINMAPVEAVIRAHSISAIAGPKCKTQRRSRMKRAGVKVYFRCGSSVQYDS